MSSGRCSAPTIHHTGEGRDPSHAWVPACVGTTRLLATDLHNRWPSLFITRPTGSSRLAQISADHPFILLHLCRCALGDLTAEIERDDLVGDRHDEVHVMLDEEDRDIAVMADAPDQRAEPRDLLVVEPAGRLIE